MIDKFEELLKDLSLQLETELHVDQNGACLIAFNEKIKVQLELDESTQYLIVFIILCNIAPGKFKETVFTNALKENNKFPYIAIFSFSEKENSIALHNFLHFASLTGETLSIYLQTFSDVALLYLDAFSRGQSFPILTPKL